MRLLLDVHHSPTAAKRLGRKGHDVLAAADDTRLSVLADEDLLRACAVEGRTIVTENAKDFDRIIRVWSTTGEHHSGIVFTSPRRFHRGGLAYPEDLAVALERLLAERTEGDHEDWAHWLE
ncbi:MAG TPA: DUF5615 family PIN-like protein [Acidimicrobiales bacterium]|nr:DUF5615 family PIN-like protein [Acidimicrobiales bacterium]